MVIVALFFAAMCGLELQWTAFGPAAFFGILALVTFMENAARLCARMIRGEEDRN